MGSSHRDLLQLHSGTARCRPFADGLHYGTPASPPRQYRRVIRSGSADAYDPRTFYEEFQARWPALFRAVEKRVAKVTPPAVVTEAQVLLHKLLGEDQELLDLIVDQQRRLLGGQQGGSWRLSGAVQKHALNGTRMLGTFILYGKRSF